MKSNQLTVEFDTEQNANVSFPPLGRTMRGRFDVRRMKDAGRLFHEFPEPIPGHRLQIDFATGQCEIDEPLYESQYEAVRERIESKGLKLAPMRESVNSTPATLHHWLRELIDAKKCKVLSGELPAKVDGVPQLRFHSQERPDAVDRLAAAIERQTAAIETLLIKLAK
jgi:hypothetical protein